MPCAFFIGLPFQDIDPSSVSKTESWDYNVVTPGTPFMAGLANHLRGYFKNQLLSDNNWTHLQVIFSDSNEPGEGEHKIVRFLRSNFHPSTDRFTFWRTVCLFVCFAVT